MAIRRRVCGICVMALFLTGCGSKEVNNVNFSRVVDEIKSVNNSILEDSSLNNRDEYLTSSSYKDLIDDKEGIGSIFNTVKLKEPVKVDIGIVEETPSDESFVKIKDKEKDSLTSLKESIVDILVGSEVKEEVEEDILEDDVEIDRNKEGRVLPEAKKFLYDLNQYIGNDVINNGFVLLYSYDESKDNNDISIDYILSRLKLNLESLEIKNKDIKSLYGDNEMLLNSWDKCYKEVRNAEIIINKMIDKESIKSNSKSLNIDALYKVYNSFRDISYGYLIDYIPN